MNWKGAELTPAIRTRPDGSKYPLTGRGGGGGALVAVLAALLLGGGALGAGVSATGAVGGGAAGDAGAVAGSLPGNLSGDVGDSLPGQDLATRRTAARSSAKRGRGDEAWSRYRLKQLARKLEHSAGQELDCLAAATGRVREFLQHTPCTSLDRMLLAVGDGRGNAAVVSVVRVGFRTAADAKAFQQVEDAPGSGDIHPLEIAAVLHLAGITLTAQHYHSRLASAAVVVAEADTATGHLDGQLLDAIADTASYLPLA